MNIALLSPGDEVSALAVAGLTKYSPLLTKLNFYAVGGNADTLNKKIFSDNETIFRTLNADNGQSPVSPVDIPLPKKIVSFDAAVDVVLEDRNIDAATELAQRTMEEAENASFLLQTALIESATTEETANAFNGIRALVPANNRLTSGVVVPVGSDDEKVSAQQIAIETLLSFVQLVRGGAEFVLMNELLKVRFLTVAKALGYYRLSKDEVGAELDMVGPVSIIGAGYKANGSLNLPFTETDGSSSIFAFRTGERANLTALTSVGIKGRFVGQVGNLIKNNVNFDCALALTHDKALWQSEGWKLV